ncbi:unnamed protein product [Lactuca saligna]|uniref:Uncharacterized protein n=1 Tax=Lactuca saligna TaxID=75948 RepID=A0AA36EQ91_LACSI|nr:unnamed protein product [Lactuca saligna]
MFETGGSSSILEYSPTRPSLNEAYIRLVKHLAQSSPTSSHGKGISFKEGRTDDGKSSSPDLREEIGILRQQLIEKSIQMDQLSAYIFVLRAIDEEKTKQINELQTSLGSPHGIVDPPTDQLPPATNDLPVNPPAPITTTTVNRFEKEPEGSRARITIKQGKRIVTANQSEGLLFMKKSNENRKARDPVLIVTNLKKRKFGDKYGDRTDELSRAPFHNPCENLSASNFKRFLDTQVRENFPSMKTAKALYRKDKDVLDIESGEPMKIILQPATKKQKLIPIPTHFHEGYLDSMEIWAYDDKTATAAIKFKDQEHVLRLINAKDLLRFRERDIRTLARHQIICRKDVMEAVAKEFTAMVATIINGRMWMGSMGRLDLRLFEKPAEKPNK